MNYIGGVVGIISLAYAIYTQNQVKKHRKYQIGKLRSSLKDCITVMSESFKLMQNPEKFGVTESNTIKRISAIHTVSATLIRSLFHELSEIDTPFDEKKLKSYAHSGLITSKWVWEQALVFVKSSDGIEMPDLPENTKDWFEEDNGAAETKGLGSAETKK